MTRLPLVLALSLLPGCADFTAPSPSARATRKQPAAAAATATPSPSPRPSPSAALDRPPPDKAQLTKVRASHVLVAYQGARRATATRSKEEAKKLADQLLTRLKSGAKFEDIATQHSDDPSAKTRGGDLGAFDRYTMAKPFGDAAFALDIGQTSEVVETEFGYHIIKRTE